MIDDFNFSVLNAMTIKHFKEIFDSDSIFYMGVKYKYDSTLSEAFIKDISIINNYTIKALNWVFNPLQVIDENDKTAFPFAVFCDATSRKLISIYDNEELNKIKDSTVLNLIIKFREYFSKSITQISYSTIESLKKYQYDTIKSLNESMTESVSTPIDNKEIVEEKIEVPAKNEEENKESSLSNNDIKEMENTINAGKEKEEINDMVKVNYVKGDIYPKNSETANIVKVMDKFSDMILNSFLKNNFEKLKFNKIAIENLISTIKLVNDSLSDNYYFNYSDQADSMPSFPELFNNHSSVTVSIIYKNKDSVKLLEGLIFLYDVDRNDWEWYRGYNIACISKSIENSWINLITAGCPINKIIGEGYILIVGSSVGSMAHILKDDLKFFLHIYENGDLSNNSKKYIMAYILNILSVSLSKYKIYLINKSRWISDTDQRIPRYTFDKNFTFDEMISAFEEMIENNVIKLSHVKKIKSIIDAEINATEFNNNGDSVMTGTILIDFFNGDFGSFFGRKRKPIILRTYDNFVEFHESSVFPYDFIISFGPGEDRNDALICIRDNGISNVSNLEIYKNLEKICDFIEFESKIDKK